MDLKRLESAVAKMIMRNGSYVMVAINKII